MAKYVKNKTYQEIRGAWHANLIQKRPANF